VRWGTALQDQFMLPHYIWRDFEDVIADLNTHGYSLKTDWFTPHWTFRFPLIGAVEREGVELHLRQALEAWPVMGEEGAAGGAVRFVDSSLERLEVKTQGFVEGRHKILVNGWAAPMRNTGLRGEAVAGVRYRAWWPSHCLHPTIPPHTPLTVEVYDSWK